MKIGSPPPNGVIWNPLPWWTKGLGLHAPRWPRELRLFDDGARLLARLAPRLSGIYPGPG